METPVKSFIRNNILSGSICFLLLLLTSRGLAQDSSVSVEPVIPKLVQGTFGGNLLIDNQTVMVPLKHTFEFGIQHRFGTINNGYDDLAGVFAPANIRLGFAYTPIKNLQLGFGLTKEAKTWDGNVKYAIIRQKDAGGFPVSITYYGNMAVSTLKKKENFVSDYDRLSYFNQLIIARKVTEKISVQVSPSLSYSNNVAGYRSSDGSIKPTMNNYHCAIAFLGRYQLTDGVGVIANYDQPLTQHVTNNPKPNISFGFDFGTTGHSFQIFVGNYQSIVPQLNNFTNHNDYTKSQYCIGFNITRRWYDFFSKQ